MPPEQTLYWVLFMVGWYVAMFCIIPPNEGPGLSPFGFWMGLIQAFVVLWLGQAYFGFFRMVGDPTLMGIPVLTALSWIPPAILFAYFFPMEKVWFWKALYILLFATSSAIGQYMLETAGMWHGYRGWNHLATFFLAVVTHSLMTLYLILRYRKIKASAGKR